MSFSHYDEDGARTSHRTHCCIGARRATHCATGDDTTDAKEWRHVPTQENPADDASRGVPASSLSESRWLHGPNFLQLPPKRWPSAPTLRSISEDDPEVKKAVTFTTQVAIPQNPVDKLIVGISNWI